MRAIHRVLISYTLLITLFIVMFAFVLHVANPTQNDALTMGLSIALFALIPLMLAFLVWRHHKH